VRGPIDGQAATLEPPAAEYGQRILNSAVQGHEVEFTGTANRLAHAARVSRTWTSGVDEQVIEISNPADLAAESGFSGERAVYTWRQRMKSLKTLGFIDCRAGSHDYQFVLLLNPHKVLKKIKRDVPDSLYTQLFNRALDVGAKDMTEDADELIDQFED